MTLIEEAKNELVAAGYKVLSALPELKVGMKFSSPAENTLNILYSDTETTGLSHFSDEIIECGFILASINSNSGELIEILDIYQSLNEPLGASISESASLVNGLTDADVQGHKADQSKIHEMLSKADFVCTHNANFDRGMLEKFTDGFDKCKFTCSAYDIDWNFDSKKLRYILMELGYHFEGHRALEDAWAGLWALNQKNAAGETYIKQMINKLDELIVDVVALKSPFALKGELYDAGYKFHDANGQKYWHKVITEKSIVDELSFLRDNIYCGESIDSEARLDWVNRLDRFSNRKTRTEFVKIMV